MDIIPVLDIRDARVVRAVRGRREDYAPLSSRITQAVEPVSVVEALLSWYPFGTIYVADLNAIERRDNALDAVLDLTRRFPDVRFWLDAGFRATADLAPFRKLHSIRPVLGSETQSSAAAYRALYACLGNPDQAVLSLDYARGRPLGPGLLFEEPSHWPETVIVMNLDRVGTNEGPDWTLLLDIKARAGSRSIVAAGGVRDAGDLVKLRSLGIKSALLASAIHNGRLTSSEIAALTGA